MSKASWIERFMLELINEERAAVGVDPLQLEKKLNKSSAKHSDWMLDTNTFSHTGTKGTNAGERMETAGFDFDGSWKWGENLAWQSERGASGIKDDVRDLHEALMKSPGHRANILDADFEVVGIGIETGNFRGYDAIMITQNYARTDGRLRLEDGMVAGASGSVSDGPGLRADDIVLSRTKGGWSEKLKPALDVIGGSHSGMKKYALRDDEGRDNFRIDGKGVIDADDGYVLAANKLKDVKIRADKRPGESTVEVRAHDGDGWGEWLEVTIATVSPVEWHDMM